MCSRMPCRPHCAAKRDDVQSVHRDPQMNAYNGHSGAAVWQLCRISRSRTFADELDNYLLCYMKQKTVLCFGVLEKYNLGGIGNDSAYTLYWKCLDICCLVLAFDIVVQIIKLAAPNASLPKTVQTLLYLASFILVAVMVASYPGLTCDGDRHEITALWPIDEQIKSVRECVIFDGLYMGIRSLVYSLILVKGKQRVAR